jgi:hypothetical protein
MTIRVAWSPSTDPNIEHYDLQSSADKVTWTDRVAITHNLAGANYIAIRGVFFWDDATGSVATWYRVRATDALAQDSSWSPPFQAALTCTETETNLCNQALARLGITRPLTDYDADPSVEGVQARLHYPAVLRELQESFDWPWSRRRATLVLTAVTATDYQYVYSLPDDCLKPLALACETDPNPRWDERIPFAVEGDGTYTGLLLTDQEDAELKYRALVENVCYFPPIFKKALTLALASRLAAALKKDEALAERVGQEANSALRVAMSLAANTGQPEAPPISSFEAARR